MHPVDRNNYCLHYFNDKPICVDFSMNPDFPQNIQVIETHLINIRKIEKEPYF